MSDDTTIAQPKLELVPPRPKRAGWYSPTKPGPSRRALASAVSLGLIALVAWLVLGIDAQHRIDTHAKPVIRTLREAVGEGNFDYLTVVG